MGVIFNFVLLVRKTQIGWLNEEVWPKFPPTLSKIVVYSIVNSEKKIIIVNEPLNNSLIRLQIFKYNMAFI